MGHVKRVLIVSPTSVCAVWGSEFSQYAGFPYTIRTLLGDKAKRLKDLKGLERFPHDHLKVAVINFESAWRDEIFEALQAYDADMIICDESQRIKTWDTAQSRALHHLGDKARYKMILSGTPIQNNAVDIYSQYRFLDPAIFGDNFYSFRSRYCIMGGFNRKQIVQYKDLDGLIRKQNSISYRVTKEDALDLPEQTFEIRVIPMDKKGRVIYDRLRRDSFAELEGGGTITAPTVLTRLLRLQQITGGFLVEDDSAKPKLVSKGKLNALEDILKDYVVDGGKKLVIFARFLPEIHEIEALCGKVLGSAGMKAVAIYGEIKKEDRGTIVQQFQTDPDTMAFIGQIDTAGTGITLTAADTCVYYSVNFNYATYSQSLSRIHRIGQRNRCTYIHLVMEKTMDETVLQALSKKEDLAKTILDSWREYFK